MMPYRFNLSTEIKYASLISSRLAQFKVKKHSPYLANFKCPFCEFDTSSKKTRGYFYESNGRLCFKCHNCNIPYNFSNVIKHLDDTLFKNFILECFSGNGENHEKSSKIEEKSGLGNRPVFNQNPLKLLKEISQLSENHYAREYLNDRKLENFWHSQFYHCAKFATWVNSFIPNKLPKSHDEPRLVIPFYDTFGKLFAFQGRSYEASSELRYITIILDESKPKVWGLNYIKKTEERIYIFEGAMDASFIENSLAMGGADLSRFDVKPNMVFIFDNEKRNKEIVKRMSKILEAGHQVCIWPERIKEKDVNNMILAGYDKVSLKKIIDANIFHGLSGKMRLAQWKRC